MTLADDIRRALAAAHDAIERTPFAAALAAGTVTRAAYAAGLRQLGHLHAGLEAALAAAVGRSPEVAAVYRPADMDRTAAVDRDLAALGEPPVSADPPLPAADRLVARYHEWAADAPWKLVGPLYVAEGSRMGSMLLARAVGTALGLSPRPGGGLDYHADGLATRPADWARFRAAVSALDLPADRRADVVAAASAAMDGLLEVYAALPAAEPAAA